MAETCFPINGDRTRTPDDHAVVRQGIAAIISNEPDMNVVAQAKDEQQALDLYCQHQPDMVLMDLQMPKVDGVTASAQN